MLSGTTSSSMTEKTYCMIWKCNLYHCKAGVMAIAPPPQFSDIGAFAFPPLFRKSHILPRYFCGLKPVCIAHPSKNIEF